MNPHWYILYTKSRCEKKVALTLSKNDFENYCPLNCTIKQWSDRKKKVYEPLFPSYVFIKISADQLYKSKECTSNIVNFVYWLGKPAIITDTEIENIKNFLNNYINVKLEKSQVKINDRVKILSGSLMNMEGNITSISNNKVKLFLPSLGYIVTAETSLNNIEIVKADYELNRMVS